MSSTTQRELACVALTVTAFAMWVLSERRYRRLSRHSNSNCDSWIENENLKPDGDCSLDKANVHGMRRRLFCGAQSVSYANSGPLMIVRGKGSKLYDEQVIALFLLVFLRFL